MASRAEIPSIADPAWIDELRAVQARIEGLRQAFPDTDLSHGMILDLDSDVADEVSNPSFYATRDSLIEAFSCELNSGGTLTHYIYDDHYDSDKAKNLLDGLVKILSGIGSKLAAVPKKTLPGIRVPSFGDGKKDSLARWCSTMQFLGQFPENQAFKTAQEFAAEESNPSRTTFAPWEELSSLDQFDPMKFLLDESHQADAVTDWRIRFQTDGKTFPNAIASSLTKPVVYASLNAIDKIIGQFREQPKKQVIRTAATETDEHPTSAEHVLHQLRVHHGSETSVPNFSPVKQEEFADKIGISQSEVSKMIAYWMDKIERLPGKEGHAKYVALCRREEIRLHLDLLSTPKSMRERLLEDLKRKNSDKAE